MDRKISAGFASRLDRLGEDAIVTAVVMIKVEVPAKPAGRRMTWAERQAAMEFIKKSANGEFPAIDVVIDGHGGRRLSVVASALGSVIVETTPAGLEALAALDQVKAILEDQPVSRA